MRRKYAQPSLPNLYFRDGVLSVPGYTFDKVSLTNFTTILIRPVLLVILSTCSYLIHLHL